MEDGGRRRWDEIEKQEWMRGEEDRRRKADISLWVMVLPLKGDVSKGIFGRCEWN